MADDSALSLARAHLVLLRSDAQLATIVLDRIFDYIPRSIPYPFVIYHITNGDEWDTTCDNGEEHTVFIHAYDDYEGPKRARQVMRRVFELIHDKTNLPLVDHNLVNCRRVFHTMDREEQLYHGVSRYRAITEEL